MNQSTWVQCPFCFESIELILDPESYGEWVEDCEVCCNPWLVKVRRLGGGQFQVEVGRTG